MKNKHFKKIISFMLALVICVLPLTSGLTAFAATKKDVYNIDLPRGNEPNKDGWGHPALDYLNGWCTFDTDFITAKAMGDYEGNSCYCIEPGVPLFTGDELTKEAENFWDNYPTKYNKTIEPAEIKQFIGRILQYGWTGKNSVDWISTSSKADDCANYLATQLLIWETVVGERDSDFNKVDATDYGKHNVKESIRSNHPLRSKIFSHYNDIATNVKNHTKTPSFTAKSKTKAKTYELKWNGTKYTTSITDTNSVLSKYEFSASGVDFSVSGNTLTISATKAFTDEIVITANKKNSNRKAVITWTDEKIGPNGDRQDVVTYGESVSDPVKAFLNVEIKEGNAKIIKESEDGKVSGIKFTLTGNNITRTGTTDSNGNITFENLPAGTYTITEEAINKYVPQKSKTVTVIGGQTASVSFSNILKRSDIKVIKSSEDKFNEGHKFHLYGTSLSGAKVDEYATTNSSGVATFKNVLIGTGYTLEEVDTAIRYVIPANQTAAVEWEKVNEYKFNNILKKFRVKVVKEDIEKGHAQGDAKLAGAVYGLYKGETLMASYTTDNNASFTTDYFVCDTDWTLREISSSEGYLLDKTIYKVGADPKLYTVEFNTTNNKVQEQVIKGNIAIIKHTDDGSTQIETPEKNAEFQVYLKSAGSYSKADPDERDTIVCDEDGFASTKLMPYGVYTVHQTKGWAGRELIKDFDVFINKDGKTYKFLINNANFCSYLKVVKLDKETNKPIAYAGAAFEIYNDEGHRVNMQFTYPKVTTIHTFYTNSEGYLITPEQLPYGDYTLKEVQAPYGYVLDDKPIPFSITQENSSTDTGVTVVKVKARDIAQKGVIEITKTGEVFTTVNENEGVYTPVYEIGNLKNAVFEIYAAEDVTTLDDTVRYQQGEKVDEITTGKDGIAKSKELYLGKYTVVEKTAPSNYVNASEQYDVELTYAGQNVSVTSTALSVNNDRQKVMLSLAKAMEHNETFGIGMNKEILSVQFGVFANEDIKAADGSIIPADALITFASCNEEGKITFDCDLPIGFKFYVKEMGTDEHYILSDTKYEFETTYAGQDISLYDININNNSDIENKLIYGSVKGLKVDRETNEVIKGAVFGLFKNDETEYVEANAILTATSDENGVFVFDNLPYGSYVIKELKPAENYLPNEEYHHITVNADKQVIEITVVNDRIPEIKTTATIDGQKECCATEVFSLVDRVEYKHLIPGKQYLLKGKLMDKATGKPFLENGNEIVSEVTFIPETPSGTVDVLFTFDSKLIKAETSIVVFETLYRDSKELVVHASLDDEEQTVTVKIPNIKTTAKVNGKKAITLKKNKNITITDTVSFDNLTANKEYTLKGILMNKATNKPFLVDGKEVTAEVTFTPDKSSGTIEVEFTFDGSAIKKDTELVVFETLYRDGVELALHADINDKEQTVKIEVPVPKPPKTSDDSNIALWIALAGASAVGIIGTLITLRRKNEEEE